MHSQGFEQIDHILHSTGTLELDYLSLLRWVHKCWQWKYTRKDSIKQPEAEFMDCKTTVIWTCHLSVDSWKTLNHYGTPHLFFVFLITEQRWQMLRISMEETCFLLYFCINICRSYFFDFLLAFMFAFLWLWYNIL